MANDLEWNIYYMVLNRYYYSLCYIKVIQVTIGAYILD